MTFEKIPDDSEDTRRVRQRRGAIPDDGLPGTSGRDEMTMAISRRGKAQSPTVDKAPPPKGAQGEGRGESAETDGDDGYEMLT